MGFAWVITSFASLVREITQNHEKFEGKSNKSVGKKVSLMFRKYMPGYLPFCVNTQVFTVAELKLKIFLLLAVVGFYRAMQFSAKRGIAIVCRLSFCPSVCNVGEL